ncbi:MAG: C40 family peptidase [Dorea sp.]|jgi:cell wall-associated NlpC family hydrolase|nr:C40 family peptidase [Dorea sp.]MCI9614538.1 C40 family peptidase [Dorea sp.]GFI51439.1 putative endopeptidase [Lachnospiraceae bacterium]
MDSVLKKGLFLVTTAGAITAFPGTAYASDTTTATDDVMPQMGIEEVLNNCYSSDKEIAVEEYLVPTEKGEYLDMAFADVETFLYIRSEPTRESEWVGKLYPDYAAKILGPVGEWTKIQSGEVTGYVCSEYIIIGNHAEEKAQEMVQGSDGQGAEEVFTYAESREEEEARLAKEAEEAAARAREEAEAKAGTGQAIVDFACQFIGNPYVWGGTSLTNGADCSGFVQSVFAHFGVSLPRTTRDLVSVGTPVSYDQAIPGDLILYSGHVGIYMGNGQIVNAINSAQGIGILPATYTNIVTVRRII